MHVFVTGASGWIAAAVIPELDAGRAHRRRASRGRTLSADTVEGRGADVVRGSLTDLDTLRARRTRRMPSSTWPSPTRI